MKPDSRDLRVGCQVRVRDGVGMICNRFPSADGDRLTVKLPDGSVRRPLVSSVVPYRRRQREEMEVQ